MLKVQDVGSFHKNRQGGVIRVQLGQKHISDMGRAVGKYADATPAIFANNCGALWQHS